MKKAAFVSITAFMMGCTAPSPILVTPVETVEVAVEVPVSCVGTLPLFPVVPDVPRAGVDDIMLVRIQRETIYLNFANELYAMLKACSKES